MVCLSVQYFLMYTSVHWYIVFLFVLSAPEFTSVQCSLLCLSMQCDPVCSLQGAVCLSVLNAPVCNCVQYAPVCSVQCALCAYVYSMPLCAKFSVPLCVVFPCVQGAVCLIELSASVCSVQGQCALVWSVPCLRLCTVCPCVQCSVCPVCRVQCA